MAKLEIKVDLGHVLGAVPTIINETVFPHLSQAVYAVAERVQLRWRQSVKAAKLWEGEKAAYIASITYQPTGPFSARVESDYKHALAIENGRPAYDLKRMLRTSNKTRAAKDGTRYLIIPFRHNTPGNGASAPAMPEAVHAIVSNDDFEKSRITGMGKRLSATGVLVPRRIYSWGDRLDVSAPKLKPTHKSNPYQGMVRMDSSAGKKQGSVYLTFRVMSEKSSGWLVPAKPGLFIVQKIMQDMQPKADIAFSKAMALDYDV
jgi:hypothetical protein